MIVPCVQVVQMDVVNDSEEELGEKLEGVYGVIDAAGYVPTYAPSLDRALSHEIDNVVRSLPQSSPK